LTESVTDTQTDRQTRPTHTGKFIFCPCLAVAVDRQQHAVLFVGDPYFFRYIFRTSASTADGIIILYTTRYERKVFGIRRDAIPL